MMNELFIPTPKPTIRNRSPNSLEVGVRVYRSSPEDLCLQLWGEKRYATVALNIANATVLRDQLNIILDDLIAVASTAADSRTADKIDGYDRDNLGESPDY